MAEEGRSRLGRGLAALIGDVGADITIAERARSQRRVPIEYLRPNPRNPRRQFADAELDDLAASIRQRGSFSRSWCVRCAGRRTPSRSSPASGAGGRRNAPACTTFRSCRSKRPTARRSSLRSSRICSAAISIRWRRPAAIRRSPSEYSHSHEDIAKIVGKSRSHVSNTLRLLKLPESVKAYINAGKITAGAARMLVGADDPEQMAREIVDQGLNVRQVESAREGAREESGQSGQETRAQECRYVALERRVSDSRSDGHVDHRGKGGVLQIQYRRARSARHVLRRLESN